MPAREDLKEMGGVLSHGDCVVVEWRRRNRGAASKQVINSKVWPWMRLSVSDQRLSLQVSTPTRS
jgi:hypothetical protein